MLRIYSPVIVTDTGRKIGSVLPIKTRAETERGVVAAIRKAVGVTNAHMCGEQTVAVEGYIDGVGKFHINTVDVP